MALHDRKWRRSGNQIVTSLLLAVIVLLLGIIVILLVSRETHRSGAEREEAAEVAHDSRPDSVPEPPKPVGDPQRIREVLQEGKTYESLLKVGVQATVIDADWGVRRAVHLTYVAEFRTRRTIERNDGKTVVLVYHVVESRATKLLSDVEVTLDLGQPGFVLLAGIDQWLTGGAGAALLASVRPVAERVLTASSQARLQRATAKAKALLDSLEGKRMRVTYADGQGVVNLEPVDCQLDEHERAYVQGLAVLGDCYLLPDLQSKPGQFWDVDARALADFLPPTWRGRPAGTVTVTRSENFQREGRDYAALEITAGTFRVDATDRRRRRLGEVTPRGRLDYNIDDGYIDQAHLHAEAHLEDVSTDHLLFETRFETTPHMDIQYSCRRMDGGVDPTR